jgi:hypothetical protein
MAGIHREITLQISDRLSKKSPLLRVGFLGKKTGNAGWF